MPDTEDTMSLDDELKTSPSGPATPPAGRKMYAVKVEGGIFKNGRLYRKGSNIELDPDTAKRFIDLDELEEK